MSLFVDTSAFYASVDETDRFNESATNLLAREERPVTSEHVLVETWLLVGRRLSVDAADRFWDGLRRGAANVEPVGAVDLQVAWEIGQRFRDQGFSIVDRTSFAVMERLGIHRAATFDQDFAIYRFGPKRDRAFEIVR